MAPLSAMEDVAIADEQLQDDVKESTVLVCEGADVFILDRSGMQRVLETAIQRSSILSEMQESPGTSTLPVSNDSFVMWLELVDNGADCSNWTQHSDLRDVAQVAEFLKDQAVVTSATARLGQLLRDLMTSGKPTSELVQVLSQLHTELLTSVFASTDLRLHALLPITPPAMAVALLRRHLRTVTDSLDISDQLYDHDNSLWWPSSGDPNPHFQTLAPILSSMEPLAHLAARSVGLCAADVPALSAAVAHHAPHLRSLDISDNPIGATGAAALAPVLSHLAHLTSLDISGCAITARRAPRALAPALGAMPGLRRLDLSRNNLSDMGVRVLCPVLWKLTSLEELRLAGNGLAHSPADLAAVVARMRVLRLLDVSNNRAAWLAAACLVGAAARLPCLEELDLSRALLVRPLSINQQADADTEIRQLFEAGHRSFWSAHLQGPPVGPDPDDGDDGGAPGASDAPEEEEEEGPPQPQPKSSMGILAGSLTGNLLAGNFQPMFRRASADEGEATPAEAVPTAPLKRLRLRNAAIHTNLFQRLCCAVVERFVCSPDVLAVVEAGAASWSVAQHLEQLVSIDFSDIPVGNGPLLQMMGALVHLPALREIHAANCSMAPHGFHMVCNSMPTTARHITLLDWSRNFVTDDRNRDNLRHVSMLTALQDLRLRRCCIGAEDAAVLAAGLRSLRALRRLDLARNGLGASGAAAVVAAVAALPAMRYLHCGARYGVAEEEAREALPAEVVFELNA